jgi:putative flavoprotein involved in K+ transport
LCPAVRQDWRRFRPRLVSAEGRNVRFADGSTLDDVGMVVWAMGYRSDYTWIQIPGVLDRVGRVVHRRGVADVPGLYLLGLSWRHTRGSALLGFLHEDAAYLGERIAAQHCAGGPAMVGVAGQ